jgi:probable F420-dependent oxidoreductase
MSTLSIGPVGITLNEPDDGSRGRLAAELEELGYATIWLAGGQLDRLDRIDEILAATTAVPVGSAIIPVDRYEPGAVAALHARSGGRFIAGLGGPQQARPLSGLTAWLDRLDRAAPPVPASDRILAALGPRKLELAASRAAGAIPLLVTPAYTAWARDRLGPEPTLVISQLVVLDEDPERARETARGSLRFLSGVRGYQAGFARMGFSPANIQALSDRLVDELVAWGSPAAITERVGAHRAAGADQVALTVLSRDGQPALAPAARLLAGALIG